MYVVQCMVCFVTWPSGSGPLTGHSLFLGLQTLDACPLYESALKNGRSMALSETEADLGLGPYKIAWMEPTGHHLTLMNNNLEVYMPLWLGKTYLIYFGFYEYIMISAHLLPHFNCCLSACHIQMWDLNLIILLLLRIFLHIRKSKRVVYEV